MCPILRLCHATATACAKDGSDRAKRLHAIALEAMAERDRLCLRIAELENKRDERHDIMTDLA
jgi:hypothetical protein